jgi:hypothetical protein
LEHVVHPPFRLDFDSLSEQEKESVRLLETKVGRMIG